MSEMNLSRRSLLQHIPVAAMATSATLPAIAQTDPIFYAIARHRAEFQTYVETSNALEDGAATRAQYDEQSRIEDEARNSLIVTAPTTIAGLFAAIEWLAEYDTDCMPDTCGAWLEAFAKSEAFANLKAQGGINV